MQALVQTFFIFLFLVLALCIFALVTELAVGITALIALAHEIVVFLLVSKKK